MKTRQIGVGIMGFADLCIKLAVRYGSTESINIAKNLMTFIYDIANDTSTALGKEKGMAPVFDAYELPGAKRRNGSLTTVAPTGTLSLIANCSSGCEPNFSLNFTKECLEGEKLDMVPGVVRQWFKKKGMEPLPDYFVTTKDISIEEHVQIQAALHSSGCDSGVSKTINAAFDTDKS